MIISVQWLSDYLPGSPIDPAVAADALMRGGLPVEKITTVGNDTVLDVEVTSNRSDCLSHVGVARELAALLGREFRQGTIAVKESGQAVEEATFVRIDPGAEKLCPYYIARVIRGIKVGPSPAWLMKRLEAVGVRAINNVVDITNYVMFELGQPLHAFDFDTLAGGRIIVRAARPGEVLKSIDGHERRLTAARGGEGAMLVIADAEKPVALAGVMGGLATEVTEKTVAVLLESARFDPLCVRRTSRSLSMKSDSSYRFERGIDPTLPERASRRAAQLLCEIAGGELLAGVTEAGSANFVPKQITLRPQRLTRLLGVEIAIDEAVDALRRLGLAPRQSGEGISVTVPSWRLDLNIETDLIEEVARVIGYDRIPIKETISIVVTPPAPEARAMEMIRATLVAAGFFEAVTFTFASDELAGDFLPPEHTSLPRADAAVRKADARLRPSLLPGLLEAVRRNEANGSAGVKFFEAGSTFGVDAAGKLVETRKLALVGDQDLRAVRGAVEAILGKLDATRGVAVIPPSAASPTAIPARPGYAAGACGRIEWGGKPVGYLGRLDRMVAGKISLRESPAAAELDLPALLAGTQHVPQLCPLPRFPAVRRDVSLIVKDATRYDAIDALVRKLSLADLEAGEFVTTYRGKPLEKGQKSVTITLVFRSPTTTLTSEAVEASVQRVIEAAKSDLGAALRT